MFEFNLRLFYVFHVCLSVCASALITYAIYYYLIHYYATAAMYIAAYGGLQVKLRQMKVVMCCLDGENLVGSRKDPVFVAYSY